MSVLAQLFVNALHLASVEQLEETAHDKTLQYATRKLALDEILRRNPDWYCATSYEAFLRS